MKRGAYNVDVKKAAEYKAPYTVCLDDLSTKTLRKLGKAIYLQEYARRPEMNF